MNGNEEADRDRRCSAGQNSTRAVDRAGQRPGNRLRGTSPGHACLIGNCVWNHAIVIIAAPADEFAGDVFPSDQKASELRTLGRSVHGPDESTGSCRWVRWTNPIDASGLCGSWVTGPTASTPSVGEAFVTLPRSFKSVADGSRPGFIMVSQSCRNAMKKRCCHRSNTLLWRAFPRPIVKVGKPCGATFRTSSDERFCTDAKAHDDDAG